MTILWTKRVEEAKVLAEEPMTIPMINLRMMKQRAIKVIRPVKSTLKITMQVSYLLFIQELRVTRI